MKPWIYLAALAAVAALAAEKPVRLIAHRGGVVEGNTPENSAAALEDAIRRGYWMVECDIQETKDGHLMMQHDGFDRNYGDPRWPRDMDWAEIRKLTAKGDGSHPLLWSEYARLCRGRIQVMIDTKGPNHPARFYQEMERVLRENGLLAGAYFIGTQEARDWFKGKARVNATRAEIEKAAQAGEDTGRLYFLFEHGTTLDEAGLQFAARHHVPAVVSINDFHYAGRDHMKAAHADIVRLRALGLEDFQIDSIYDRWLR